MARCFTIDQTFLDLSPSHRVRRVRDDFTSLIQRDRAFSAAAGAISGRATRVAPGIERGELGSEEQTDYATTE
jgi:hypothetical protein